MTAPMTLCDECGDAFARARRGRPPRFCSDACRKAHHGRAQRMRDLEADLRILAGRAHRHCRVLSCACRTSGRLLLDVGTSRG